jgi:bifunctional DNA-binding transcriptional regulator/antitoxin component of YhaV-PrlF toxin-antitoxin module
MDGTGRIVIPSKLRDEMKFGEGDELIFFIHEMDGRKFLCIEATNLENEIEKAKRILREAGIKL